MEAQTEHNRRQIVSAMTSLTRFPTDALTDLRITVALAGGPEATLESVAPEEAQDIGSAAWRLTQLIEQARADPLLRQIVTAWTQKNWDRIAELGPAITTARQKLQNAIDCFPVPTGS